MQCGVRSLFVSEVESCNLTSSTFTIASGRLSRLAFAATLQFAFKIAALTSWILDSCLWCVGASRIWPCTLILMLAVQPRMVHLQELSRVFFHIPIKYVFISIIKFTFLPLLLYESIFIVYVFNSERQEHMWIWLVVILNHHSVCVSIFILISNR